MRRRRDDSANKIRSKMLDIRTTFERVYGAGLSAEVVGLDGHEPQKRRTQVALHEKREALEAFNFAVNRIARYLQALCYLAGMDFHAERVRQSSHVTVGEDETFEAAEEEAPEADASGEEPEIDAAES